MTKQCELCDLPARMFCESDEASLCWECDARVHGANFLVARHCRRLLCRSCQAPTPWRASGSRLGSTVSVCNRCSATRDGRGGRGGGGDEEGRRGGFMGVDAERGRDIGEEEEEDSEEEEDEDDEEDEYEEADEDGDNQVVPWSMEADAEAVPSPRPAASQSSSDDSSSDRADVYYGLKTRKRETADLPSSYWQEDTDCSPSQHGYLRFSPAGAEADRRRMLEEEAAAGKEEAAASDLGCSFRALADRMRAVRPRLESAGPFTPHRSPFRGGRGVSPTADPLFSHSRLI